MVAKRVPRWLANRKFKTQLGHEVSFILMSGEWQARVTDRSIGVSGMVVMPVVCTGHGDVEAALKDLRGKPAEYVERRIHVNRTRGLNGVTKEYVCLGEQCLTTNGSSSLHSLGSCARNEQEELEDIGNMKDLVRSLNDCRAPEDKEKMMTLLACVQECIKIFNSRDIGYWTENSGYALHEFSTLAGIKIYGSQLVDHFCDEKKEVLKDFFTSLIARLTNSIYAPTSLMQAICFSLRKMDISVFAENPGWLLKLAIDLLKKLDSTDARYTRTRYAEQNSVFLALHRVLVIVGLVDPDQWDIMRNDSLLARFRESLKKIDNSARYYPVHFHVLVLEQSMIRMTSGVDNREDVERAALQLDGMEDMQKFTCELSLMYTIPTGATGLGFTQEQFAQRLRPIRRGLSHHHVREHHWFDAIMDISQAYVKSLTSTAEDSVLTHSLDRIEAQGRRMHKGEDRIALRFGFVQQLRLLVLNHPIYHVRKHSLEKLLQCAINWQDDVDVLEEVLESLIDIANKCGYEGVAKLATKAALVNILTNLDDRGFWLASNLTRNRTEVKAHVDRAVAAWKREQGLEMTVISTPTRPDPSSEEWRCIIKECLRGQDAKAAAMHTQQLKDYYRDATFACLASILPGIEGKHVESLEFELILLGKSTERKDPKLKSRIALKDIFNESLPQPGERQHDIRKVIIVGQAGAGKSALSHKLAYEWSEGRWCNDLFDNLYVLPVRQLLKSKYNDSGPQDPNLATAIAHICFHGHHSDDEYEALRNQININLKSNRTLVVLDGFEDQHGVQMQILDEAKSETDKEHKLLLFSRPHGTVGEMADREVRQIGFSSHQMESYVQSELSPELSEDLLGFIRQQSSLKEIFCMPLNLVLLCHLWEDPHDRGVICSHAESGGAPGLYRIFTDYYWTQIQLMHTEQDLRGIDRETLFGKLGRIALSGLTQKLEMLTRGFIQNALAEDKQGVEKILNLAGFLLVECQRNGVSFPHKTFQEYFAGRLLAKLLLSDKPEEIKGERLLCEHKYNYQSRNMLLFMAGEMSRESGQECVQTVLTLIDEKPREAVGLQHLVLQLQLLCACMSSARSTIEWDISLEEEFKLVESVLDWLCKGLHMKNNERFRSNILDVLANALADSHIFLSRVPELQDTLVRISENEDSTSRVLAIHMLGTIFGACQVGPPDCVLDRLLRAPQNEVESACLEAIHSLGLIFKPNQSQSKKITDCLIKCLHDDRVAVSHAATQTLISVFKYLSAPEVETVLGEVLIAVEKGGSCFMSVGTFQEILAASPYSEDVLLMHFKHASKNEDHSVRAATMAALGGIFFKISASEMDNVLETLTSTCSDDEHASVRLEATKALGELLAQTKNHDVCETLMHATNDEDIRVQLHALQALLMPRTNDLLSKNVSDVLWNHLKDVCFGSHGNHCLEALHILGLCFEPSLRQAEEILASLMTAARNESAPSTTPGANDALVSIYKRHPSRCADIVEHFITRSGRKFGVAVRFDAIWRLGMLAIGSQEKVESVWELLINLLSDDDANIRYYAIETLVTVARDNPFKFADFSECLSRALKDNMQFVQSKARSLLGEIPAQYLMKQYWETGDDELIPAIASCLCRAALVCKKHSQNYHDVVLYQTGGDSVPWGKPSHEVESFIEKLTLFLVSYLPKE